MRIWLGLLTAATVLAVLALAPPPAAACESLSPTLETAPTLPPAAVALGEGSSRSGELLFLILAAGFFVLWHWYRKESEPEYKVRLAAAAALASLLFLAVTPAMPWLVVEDPTTRVAEVECLLGQEAECAAASLALRGASSLPPGEVALRAFEVQRWQIASATVQIGQVLSLALLLPALIWLIVAPRNRAAQAAMAVGASAAALTVLGVLFFRAAVPSWLPAKLTWTSDLALMASIHIVVAAVLVVRHGFAMLAPPAIRLPAARVRRH